MVGKTENSTATVGRFHARQAKPSQRGQEHQCTTALRTTPITATRPPNTARTSPRTKRSAAQPPEEPPQDHPQNSPRAIPKLHSDNCGTFSAKPSQRGQEHQCTTIPRTATRTTPEQNSPQNVSPERPPEHARTITRTTPRVIPRTVAMTVPRTRPHSCWTSKRATSLRIHYLADPLCCCSTFMSLYRDIYTLIYIYIYIYIYTYI